jgi:site-specific DNA-methyltransferase (adenine-specific)
MLFRFATISADEIERGENMLDSGFYNMDCMDGMAQFPDKYFELAIVDPPYGIGVDGNTTVVGKSGKASTFSSIQHHEKKQWDTKRPPRKYFDALQRVSKNQIIWGGNYFADLLPAKKGWVFWDKKITNANNTNFSDGELAWTSFNCILRRFTYDWIGFGYLNNPQGENKIHPTQKPVKLYEWLLMNYAKQGDKILDTHVGSASSLIACHNMGFEYWGFELDEDYYKAANERLNAVKAQMKLW